MNTTEIKLPTVAFRAAIHNQIYNSRYYHVSKYVPGKKRGWNYLESWGYRGKGNNLGMTGGTAVEVATIKNLKEGWGNAPRELMPDWMDLKRMEQPTVDRYLQIIKNGDE
jgi:hypothetical protein